MAAASATNGTRSTSDAGACPRDRAGGTGGDRSRTRHRRQCRATPHPVPRRPVLPIRTPASLRPAGRPSCGRRTGRSPRARRSGPASRAGSWSPTVKWPSPSVTAVAELASARSRRSGRSGPGRPSRPVAADHDDPARVDPRRVDDDPGEPVVRQGRARHGQASRATTAADPGEGRRRETTALPRPVGRERRASCRPSPGVARQGDGISAGQFGAVAPFDCPCS